MKADITITKDLTINCGRYSSIKPAVTMTIKDVDLNNTQPMTDKLMQVVNATWIIQACLDMKEIREALSANATEYNRTLLSRLKDAKEVLKQFTKELDDDLFSLDDKYSYSYK